MKNKNLSPNDLPAVSNQNFAVNAIQMVISAAQQNALPEGAKMVAEISNGSIAMANYRPDTREVLIYKRKDDGVTIDESIRRITLKENASIDERNAKIRERHSKGETLATLARDFGRTPARICQICKSPDKD